MEFSLSESPPRAVVAILSIDDEIKGFRGNRNNFKDLIQTGKEMGVLVYVITPRELKLMNKRIYAYLFDKDSGSWHQQWVPLPHVVYNRIPYRKDELLPEAQHKIEECLKHSQIRLFNPAFFNKWTLFEWLSKSAKTKSYIPVTRKLVKLNNLQFLIKRFPVLYLKPLHGKAGCGIMRIKKKPLGSKGYQLTVQENKTSQTFNYVSLDKLWAKVEPFSGSEEYIVQQGIQLASSNQRPFDLRMLIQKNNLGKWVLTGVGARVAGLLNITTHVPRGGSIDDPEKLLIAAFGDRKAKRILTSAKRAALRISRQIERGSGQTLGEMSIDLGVDTTGQLWFFEANAKPMKFDEPHIRGKSLEHLIQYCIYLSKLKRLKKN